MLVLEVHVQLSAAATRCNGVEQEMHLRSETPGPLAPRQRPVPGVRTTGGLGITFLADGSHELFQN